MTLLPVIERELRAESRNSLTYWLRVVGGVSLLGTGLVVFLENGLAAQSGGQVFSILQAALLAATWFLVPLMTADCISREKREGTLGLLFLTPLRPFEVVLAKGFAQGLRALTLCLATIPMLVVPFLIGGVGWKEALAAILMELSSCFLAVGAGLLASAWNKSLTWTMGWALGLAGLLVTGSFLLMGLLPVLLVVMYGATNQQSLLTLETIVEAAGAMLLEFSRIVQGMSMISPTYGTSLAFGALGVLTLLSMVAFLFMLFLAAVGVRRHAHERPRSETRIKVEKKLCTPTIGANLFRRWMQRLLGKNPIGWLERRTWQSRVVVWSWIGIPILFYTVALPGAVDRSRDLSELHLFMAWLLLANVALSACCSLRRERETGLIELLLVSPLTVGQIITGRLRGLWGQFLPVGALLIFFWLWMHEAFFSAHAENMVEQLALIGLFANTLVILPVLGLYFSMRCRMLVTALFCTAILGICLPACATVLLILLGQDETGRLLENGFIGFIAATGLAGIGLAAFPVRGLRQLSFLFALALLAACAGGILLWTLESPTGIQGGQLPAALVFAALQIILAIAYSAGLRQILERRKFSLPA